MMSDERKNNETLYAHAGGWDAIYKHVEIFYRSCLADPILQPLFGHEEQPGHIEKFAAFTAETFGGPDRFTKEMGGFMHLIDVHRGFKITEEQRQRFVNLYVDAADKAGLLQTSHFVTHLNPMLTLAHMSQSKTRTLIQTWNCTR